MAIMSSNYLKLAVRKDTYALITGDCIKEFIKHNPEIATLNIKVTHDMILSRIAKHYLGRL